ncbi:Heme exporter protein B [Paraburkholderia ultramafica]|uniref:Heme exporter protein B n=1 Tax=Paraburkholderia ultramafica TaxID=1544867 RepID=A0A6S7BHV4_9BURK|nr:heme exporter protein CcmB [Paraburkholderia ultramafica]CAB3800601.1 Heme exporter protein B [Paraburkholderia ultramafica]
MRSLFLALYKRDLKLAMRRRIEAFLPIVFFAVAVSLFPLGVGPERETLRQIAPGIVWVCALLAAMLSVTHVYAGDFADGSLEQMLLSGHGAVVIAAAKSAAHWTVTGLPLVISAPIFGLLLDMDRALLKVLTISLLLGTPVLSLLGSVGAALALGLRSAGVLIFLLVLPLSIPALIFGTGAVEAVEAGQSPGGHYSILGALLIFTALTAPPATAAALRISMQ